MKNQQTIQWKEMEPMKSHHEKACNRLSYYY